MLYTKRHSCTYIHDDAIKSRPSATFFVVVHNQAEQNEHEMMKNIFFHSFIHFLWCFVTKEGAFEVESCINDKQRWRRPNFSQTVSFYSITFLFHYRKNQDMINSSIYLPYYVINSFSFLSCLFEQRKSLKCILTKSNKCNVNTISHALINRIIDRHYLKKKFPLNFPSFTL